MRKAVSFLKSIQWSSGCGGERNKGQCSFCWGVSKEWLGDGHPCVKDYGHKPGCDLAEALESLGIRVDYIKDCK